MNSRRRSLICSSRAWSLIDRLKFVQTKPLWSLLDHDQYLELPRISNKSGPDLWGWGARGVGAGSSGGKSHTTLLRH